MEDRYTSIFEVVIIAPDRFASRKEAADNLHDLIMDALGFPSREKVTVSVSCSRHDEES